MATPTSGPTPGGEPRKWLTLVAMTGALSMILIDMTVVSVALPSIQRDLGMSATELQWVVNAYLLALAATVALAGRSADAVGRVRIFIAGVVVFAGASAVAGLATDDVTLLAARAVEGLGGAMMIPSSQAIVTNAFPVSQRGSAMGAYAGISMAFLALGPLIGGLLTEHAGWEWVFYVNIPVAVATIGLTLAARPAEGATPGTRFDIPGTLTLVVGLTATILALMQSSVWGWGDTRTIGLFAGGVALLGLFTLIELRSAHPLIDLRIMRHGNFAADTIVLFFVQFALLGLSVFGSLYSQDVLGFDPVQAGLTLLPLTIPVLILAVPAGRLYDRLGPRLLVTLGMALLTAGLFLYAPFLSGFDYAKLVPAYVLLGIGVAFVMTPANTDAMNAAPAQLRGEASGVIQTIRQVGGTFGIAVMTSIVTTLNRSYLNDNLESLGLSGSQAKQLEGVLARAQQGQSDALAQVPDALKPDIAKVIDAAKDAFASSLTVAFLVMGGVLAVGCVMAALWLRKVDYSDRPAGAVAVG